MGLLQQMYSGRIGRVQFGVLMAIAIILSMMVGGLLDLVGINQLSSGVPWFFGFLVSAILNLFTFHIFVRRLHDLDLSGWWVLLVMVPLLGGLIALLAIIALLVIPGSAGANRYGPEPDAAVGNIVQLFLNGEPWR